MDKSQAQTFGRRAFAALEREFGVGTVEQLRGLFDQNSLTIKMKITPGGTEVREDVGTLYARR